MGRYMGWGLRYELLKVILKTNMRDSHLCGHYFWIQIILVLVFIFSRYWSKSIIRAPPFPHFPKIIKNKIKSDKNGLLNRKFWLEKARHGHLPMKITKSVNFIIKTRFLTTQRPNIKLRTTNLKI